MKPTAKALASFVSACLLLTGCGQAPSINILGSFFPAWMICVTLGVILAFVTRYFLVRFQLELEVGPLALFYPCVVVLFTCLLWLIFFH